MVRISGLLAEHTTHVEVVAQYSDQVCRRVGVD